MRELYGKTPENRTCPCGNVFVTDPRYADEMSHYEKHEEEMRLMRQRSCPTCEEKWDKSEKERQDAEVLDRNTERWEKASLPYFRNPGDHADKCKASFIKSVEDWAPAKDARGLFFFGGVGVGKTTAAWIALKKSVFSGLYVEAIESSEFSQKVAALYSRDCAEAYDWIQKLIKTDVLLIDDLGKGKLTERVEESLFSVINGRMMHLRPTIITSNHDKDSFLKQWSPERGLAILRRIKETSIMVS